MIRPNLTAVCLVLTTLAAVAQAAEPAMDDDARMNYALGYQLGRDLTGTPLRSDALLMGIEDGRGGAAPKLNEQEMQAALNSLQQQMSEQRMKQQAESKAKAVAAGSAYLAENAKKPGVTTTASGLQYKVVKDGTGRKPTASDTVTVHYRGTLVDGTEFDSSHKRGQPASFPVTGVIAGWTEALQLMKEGAQWQLFIPPDLAYGDRGPLAGQTLIFDVELISAQPGATGQ